MYKRLIQKLNQNEISLKNVIFTRVFIIISFILSGCNGKLPGGDARKFPDDPKKS
jgi:hypothetical protein